MLGTSKNEIMDYEQEYKEAISRAKIEQETFFNLGNISAKTAIERIFPELRESEDEKVRKRLIEIVKIWKNGGHARGYSDEIDNILACLEKQAEQKPTWSEEDEENLNRVGDVQTTPNQMEMLESCIDKMSMTAPNLWKKEIDWLKSLKDRVQPQPKQEWSEEDEKMKRLIISTLTSMGTLNLERYHNMNLDEVKKWLKSLKPQNHWKPSEKQMEALKKECLAHSNYELCRLLEELESL